MKITVHQGQGTTSKNKTKWPSDKRHILYYYYYYYLHVRRYSSYVHVFFKEYVYHNTHCEVTSRKLNNY